MPESKFARKFICPGIISPNFRPPCTCSATFPDIIAGQPRAIPQQRHPHPRTQALHNQFQEADTVQAEVYLIELHLNRNRSGHHRHITAIVIFLRRGFVEARQSRMLLHQFKSGIARQKIPDLHLIFLRPHAACAVNHESAAGQSGKRIVENFPLRFFPGNRPRPDTATRAGGPGRRCCCTERRSGCGQMWRDFHGRIGESVRT